MSAASCLLSEDRFLCSICLDVFTDPVSTPCGHNFCKNCISQHWDISERCQCPMCKKVFETRPELLINILFSEMVSQFRHGAQQTLSSSSSSEQQAAKPGEVPCDICTGTKLKALKSCLVCLASYCQTHLEPHLTMKGLKRHQLIEADENLESRICMKHDKPLELFCKTDQTCVCMLCSVIDHKTHDFVPLREEYEEKKAKLGTTEAEIQQLIQKRRLKIQEIKESVKKSKDVADREKAEGVQGFTALKESFDRRLNKLIKYIEDHQETIQELEEGLIKYLEEDIPELMKRSSEVEELSRSKDHLHLLQRFSSLKAASTIEDRPAISMDLPSYEGTVVRAVNQLKEILNKDIWKLFEAELKRVQQYAVDVIFDPDTAHPELIVSDDGKQVHRGEEENKLPDNPERISEYPIVLGKQSFSSGRFYFEFNFKGKTWILGVARESVNRKECIDLSPAKGYWSVLVRKNICVAFEDSGSRRFHQSGFEKVGVFVDYEEGLVSFYDVDDAALIYSFTGCSFTEKLYPFFCPGVSDDYDDNDDDDAKCDCCGKSFSEFQSETAE